MSSRPPSQRPFGPQERLLFRLYVNCTLALDHPRQLYQEYDLTYEELAYVAGCTARTMERWMEQDPAPQVIKSIYLRRLGEFYFLLHYYHQIPAGVWNAVCPLSPKNRAILYPTEE